MAGQTTAFFPSAASGVTTTTCTSLFMEGLLINKVSTLAANEGATHTKKRAINRSFFFFIVCYIVRYSYSSATAEGSNLETGISKVL